MSYISQITVIRDAMLEAGHTDRAVVAVRMAHTAADALTSDVVVAEAVKALKAEGWEETHEGPLGIGTLSDQDLADIARTVLRSVGGAR